MGKGVEPAGRKAPGAAVDRRARWIGWALTLLSLALLGLGAAVLLERVEAERADERRGAERTAMRLLTEAARKAGALVREREATRTSLRQRLRAEAARLAGEVQMDWQRRLAEWEAARSPWRGEWEGAVENFTWLDGFAPAAGTTAGEAGLERLIDRCRAEWTPRLAPSQRIRIVEEGGTERLALGAEPAEGDFVALAERSYGFAAGGHNYLWRIRVSVIDRDAPPPCTEKELVDRLRQEESARGDASSGVARWLVLNESGELLALGRADDRLAEAMDLPDRSGAWIGSGEGGWRSYLQVTAADPPCPWRLGVQLVRRDAETAERAWRRLRADGGWAALASVAGLLLGAGLLGFRGRRVVVSPSPPPAQKKEPRRRLVRKEGREIPEEAEWIVAEIASPPETAAPATAASPPPLPQRKEGHSNLAALQARYRGGEGRSSYRVLDSARSAILRELAARIRPPADRRRAEGEAEGEEDLLAALHADAPAGREREPARSAGR